MSLSAPAPRRPMHTRRIAFEGYLRDDGLWDIEATLVDTKPYNYIDLARGPLDPGSPVHDLRLRVSIDAEMTICAIEVAVEAAPFHTCPAAALPLQRLIGERIGPGWRQRVRKLIGRVESCTHLIELLDPLASAAYQTMSAGTRPEGLDQRGRFSQMKERPFFVGGCHSWREDGLIVAEYFGQFAGNAKAARHKP